MLRPYSGAKNCEENKMRLKDRTAIVAGGGQGIGEGIALCLGEEGADVAVIDINSEAAAAVAEKLKAMGRRSIAITADLTEEELVARATRDAVDFFGRVDILVNNVGGVSEKTLQMREEYTASFKGEAAFSPYLLFSPDIWDRYYKLNLKSHVMLSDAVTPYLMKRLSGRIVNISSVSGRMGEPMHLPYAAMKAADISLTWSLARSLAPYNITVNCVCPGFVYTPLWERGASNLMKGTRELIRGFKDKGEQLPVLLQRFADADAEGLTTRDYWLNFIVRPNTPMGREQTPEDIGRAIVFFASDDAKNVTGQVLNVDGGIVMR
jgi:NAD(P)-dependent dehydrogenase (short-subunit alcohol dehydrogenase family)